MNQFKIVLLFAFMMAPILNYGQYTDEINSNRPGLSMSAYAVGKSVYQVETGIYGIKENHSLLNYDAKGIGVDLTLRVGAFLEALEFVADMQYQNENFKTSSTEYNKSALKKTVFGAKYLIYDPYKNYERKIDLKSWKKNQSFEWHQMIPAVSLYAGTNYTFSNNPYHFSPESGFSPKFMLITQNNFSDGRWVFVTNVIADYVGTDFPSYGYIVTLTHGFNENWSGFVENQGYKSDFYSDEIVRGGAAYLLNRSMQIDASISSSLKTTPSILYGGIGLSWRYDANHKDKLIRIDK